MPLRAPRPGGSFRGGVAVQVYTIFGSDESTAKLGDHVLVAGMDILADPDRLRRLDWTILDD